MPGRENAIALLSKHVHSPSLRRHCLAVGAAMRAYAPRFEGDPDEWEIAGLLHDFDYEEYPEVDAVLKTGHPFEGVKILREEGYSEAVIHAILGHAQYSGVPRDTDMSKCLFACDELCGFIIAIAFMRPDGLKGIDPATVRKYLHKKKFAEKVSREDIAEGVLELGIPEEEHFSRVIQALQNSEEVLELRRS
jgi:putative nucleotidyltransferase with HDIG domain